MAQPAKWACPHSPPPPGTAPLAPWRTSRLAALNVGHLEARHAHAQNLHQPGHTISKYFEPFVWIVCVCVCCGGLLVCVNNCFAAGKCAKSKILTKSYFICECADADASQQNSANRWKVRAEEGRVSRNVWNRGSCPPKDNNCSERLMVAGKCARVKHI